MAMNTGVLKFNGKQSDDATLGIEMWTEWGRPILPEIRDRLLHIPGRIGAHDFGRELQPLYIPCKFLITGANVTALTAYARAIAAWLNVPEAKELIFGDEQDKFYMARPTGLTDRWQMVQLSRGEVTFLVPDGCAYSIDTKAASAFPAQNAGTLPCPVIITATMAEAAPPKITLDTGEYIEIDRTLVAGDVVHIDTAQRTVHVNGADARDSVTFRSSPGLLLPVGNFSLIADPVSTTISIEYRERWI